VVILDAWDARVKNQARGKKAPADSGYNPRTVTREAIVELMKRRRLAMEQRDSNALASIYADECILDSPTAGGQVKGREAAIQLFEAWFINAFPDSTAAFEDPVIDGDRVTQIVNLSGTGTGSFLGLPPTGKAYHVSMVLLTTVKNNEIVYERRIYDFTGLLMQIGVLKAKPA
jgi:steroid delta-isomerase-like uncharacterized protein